MNMTKSFESIYDFLPVNYGYRQKEKRNLMFFAFPPFHFTYQPHLLSSS